MVFRHGRVLAVAVVIAASGFLCGGYCADRGYYTLGGTATSGQVAIGPVTRFGSVFVDGTEYATTAASVTIDGASLAEGSLVVGQVVAISGAPPSGSTIGSARTLVVTTRLVGPVTGVDLVAHTLTVLGQTVHLTGTTSVGDGIAPTEVGGLLYGQLLAVDGYRTSTGFIASRVDLAAAGAPLRVVGRVSGLDGATQTFQVGGTTVAYGAVASGLPAAVTNGAYVLASGASVAGTTTLNAQQVTAEREATAGASGTSGAIHGAVTRYASATDFDLAGQAVSTSTSTNYLGGLAGSVAADVELEVAGSYDGSGVLAATTVTFVPATALRVVGGVDRIDSAAASFAVAGITLATSAATRWDDRGAVRARAFALASLRTGDWVEVRGAATGPATADARVVERRNAPSPALLVLEDDVAGLADPTLTLDGVAVDTRGATFSDVHGVVLTRNQFFATAAGHVVRARGTLASGGALVATDVSLRD